MDARRTLAALGTSLIAVVTACSFTSSLDGLSASQAPDAAIGTDGAPPPPDGTPPATQGGADAGCDAGFCACLSPAPKFCDDFDEGGSLGGKWNVVEGQGTVTVETGGASAPSALRAKTSGSTSEVASLHVTKDFPITPRTVTVRFALRFDEVVPGSEANCFRIYLAGSAGAFAATSLAWLPSGLVASWYVTDEAGAPLNGGQMPLTTPTTGVWHRYKYELTLNDGVASLKVTVDEQAPVERAIGAFPTGPLSVLAPIEYALPTTETWDIRLDDIAVDYTE